MTKGQKRNVRQEVTDKILEALKSGVAPWVKPWTGRAGDGVPHNCATGHIYRGINVILLSWEQILKGYPTSEWLTFKQAKTLGGSVRKGEKSTLVVFWKFIVKDKDTEDERRIPFLRHFNVFNRAQIDGLPEPEQVEPVADFIRRESAEYVITATGAKIDEGGSMACYIPEFDRIRLPTRESFSDPENFYATAFHELGHWTGHKSRLDRKLNGAKGKADYAFEELVAELSAAYLCAENDVSGELQHPEYIGNWIKVLESDNNAIFSASSKARKAADFIGAFSEVEEAVA
jgi:antirestriction protein ArdC